MQIISIHEAKTHFSKLVEAVSQGDEIVIARAGKPAAKLVSIKGEKVIRQPSAVNAIRVA